jgi:sensor histidine kinase
MNKRKKLKIAFGNALMMIHFIALIALIIGVVMLYTNDNLKKGITWVNNESYEDSPAFVKQLEGDIQKIFDYIRYKDVFETDGVFDLKKEMFNINMAPGEDISYTVEDVIKNAKELGYYVDDNYNFSIYEGADKALFSENSLLVNSRSYMQNVQIDEPGDAYMTLPVLIEESLNVLSKYYAAYNRLILVPGNIKYRVVYDTNKYTNDKGLNVSNVKSYGKYVISSSHSMLIDHNLSLPPSNLSYLATSYGSDVEIDDYDIMIAVDTSYPVKDEYSIGKDRYVEQRNWYFYGCVNIVCSIPIMLLSIIFTLILYKNKDEDTNKGILYRKEKWGIEVNIFIFIIELVLILFFCSTIVDKLVHIFLPMEAWHFAQMLVRYILIYISVLSTLMAIIKGIKVGTLYNERLLNYIRKQLRIYRLKSDNTKKISLYFILYTLVNICIYVVLLTIYFAEKTLTDRFIMILLFLFLIIFNFVVYHFIYKKSMEFDRLEYAVKSMAIGDINYKLEETDFSGKEIITAKSLNSIGQGLEKAISNQVKSERLKADLITNVSHDLKTPLTSIINYVDLIKREEIQNKKVAEYVDVLERKSRHLKNLTEDLLEASKLSSGNVSVEMNNIDIVEMIMQMNGEFEEKYAQNNLTLVPDLPKEAVMVNADVRHLWRILDNIYTNACKYAKRDTRVYVSIKSEEDMAVFIMKNISEYPLNINSDELTERFVRGDISRSTEGSGLGLSIAKSLADLQKAVFEIQIDGDLFKIIIKLHKVKDEVETAEKN